MNATEIYSVTVGETELEVVYHLQGETGWSTVCANGEQNLRNEKSCSRLACTIFAIHSSLQRVLVDKSKWNTIFPFGCSG